jgi:predicted permease
MPRLPGVRRFLRLPSAERNVAGAVDDELTFHLDMLTEQHIADGLSPEEARRATLLRFGDVEQVRQRCYDISTTREASVRRTELWHTLWQDLKYAARGLSRAPGFTLVVLVTLALGIGSTTAMFSVVRGVLLRPLPFPEAERLVRMSPENRAANNTAGRVSSLEMEDWSRDLSLFTAVGGFSAVEMVFGDAPEPLYVPAAHVSAGFFRALGTPPALGHVFRADEHVAGGNRGAVVSHGFWEQQLGSDPHAVGRSIRLDGEPYTIIGVMPAGFGFPKPSTSAWLSSSLIGEESVCCGRDGRWLDIVGRLKPGVTPAQGRAQVESMLARLAATYPASNAGWTAASVETLHDVIVGSVRRGLLVLLGAVGLVLLVVCVNVANLMLVRGTARERELALRAAIGAGRGRIVRLLLTESMLLAVCGGLLGVLAAWWGVRALVALSGQFLPRAADVQVDAGVLAFAVVITLLTGALFGLWPALRASRGTGTAATLREDARGSVGSGAANRARAALVTVEVAVAVVLVVGAGLMLRSFERLTAVDPGFRPDNVLLVRFSLPDPPPDAPSSARADQRRQVVARVASVPGVLVVGATKFAPLTGGTGEPHPLTVPGRPAPKAGDEPRVLLLPASPGYLRAMGIPLLAGQDVDAVDGDSTAGPVAVISRQMAERVWSGRSPIGEMFQASKLLIRVIGVAGDVRGTRLDSITGFTAYVPERNMPRSAMSMVVRTSGDPTQLITPVRAAIREVFPRQAFQEIVPFRAKLSEAASTPRFFTVLVAIFGMLALALAAVGLYGVVSYTVRQREREMAVRLALGAPPARVTGLMLRQGMTPVVIGLAVGLAVAIAVTRVLRTLLFEVSATDPVTFVGVIALLAIVALVASYLPSRRAARMHPAMTLRAE